MRVWLVLLLLAGCSAPAEEPDTYESPYGDEKKPAAPYVIFAKNGPDRKVVVMDAETELRWSSLSVDGCDPPAKQFVDPDDEMTKCQGLVRVIAANGAEVYRTEFS